MRISDWSSDVCSSDLLAVGIVRHRAQPHSGRGCANAAEARHLLRRRFALRQAELDIATEDRLSAHFEFGGDAARQAADRGERRNAEAQADGEQAQAADAGRKVAAPGPTEIGRGPCRGRAWTDVYIPLG